MKRWYKHNIYFPWTPGIPWSLLNGKYIIPKIDYNIWKHALGDREIIIAAYGGLLESFFSLSFVELLTTIEPGRKISWLGNKEFYYLVKAQGLVRISDLDLPAEKLKKYPSPFFIDSENRAYYNCLNNLNQSLFTKTIRNNKDCKLKQIFDNAMVQFSSDYIPKLRMLSQMSKEYENWKNAYKFNDKDKFILVIPGKGKCLDWADRQIKELVGLTSRFGINVVVCTDRIGVFYGQRIYLTINNPIILINLIKKAWMILADDIDYLRLGLMLSRGIIVAANQDRELYKSAEFLGVENNVLLDAGEISPMDIYRMCEGEL